MPSQSIHVRELTAPEWITLAHLYWYAEKADRGDLGENPAPLSQTWLAENLKPIDAPEALANLESEKLRLVYRPTNKASDREMKGYWDVTPKGEAVFEKLSDGAVKQLHHRLKIEEKRLSDSVISQRRRDTAMLEKLLAEMQAWRDQAPEPEPDPKPKARKPRSRSQGKGASQSASN